MINTILLIWMIGCILSYIILNISNHIREGSKIHLSPFSMILGVSASWIVVGYVIHLTIHAMRQNAEAPTLSDKEMIKQTIDAYWVKTIQYKDFDPCPSLPLKDSLLCNKYFFLTGPTTRPRLCKNCPISKAQFGCNVTGFFLHYKESELGKARQEAAITVAKVFQSVYEELG